MSWGKSAGIKSDPPAPFQSNAIFDPSQSDERMHAINTRDRAAGSATKFKISEFVDVSVHLPPSEIIHPVSLRVGTTVCTSSRT